MVVKVLSSSCLLLCFSVCSKIETVASVNKQMTENMQNHSRFFTGMQTF